MPECVGAINPVRKRIYRDCSTIFHCIKLHAFIQGFIQYAFYKSRAGREEREVTIKEMV